MVESRSLLNSRGGLPLRRFESFIFRLGEVVEWFKALVLKTSEVKASVGSNPTLSVCLQLGAITYKVINLFILQMETIITLCQGCGCDILNIRKTKGRLKKWCSDKCRSRWRYKNDPSTQGRDTYGPQKRRGYFNKWKAIQSKGGKCQTCGESRPSTLCFHHREPSQKELSLDSRTFANLKWDKVRRELDKCDLLCHNCHNVLHYKSSWDEFFEGLSPIG